MSWEAWKKRYDARQAQRERAASTPGVPVPHTGRSFWRYHRHGRKMQPYLRPRKGGGKDRSNEPNLW